MNSDYRKTKAGSLTLWLAAALADSPLKDALADGLRSLAKVYSLNKVPASKSADVYKFSCESGTFYFKQYHYRSPWDVIKHTFRPSRAMRTINATAMLAANGFLAPEIIAMGYRRIGMVRVENFLLAREVENVLPVYAFFDKHYGRSDSCLAEKRNFIRTLGRLVGELHKKNISHGDLRLGNVLVRSSFNQQPATSNKQQVFEFFFLDNERTVQYRHLPDRLRLKNLVQCNMHLSPALTHTDRLRFFEAYLVENSSLVPIKNRLAKQVHQKTQTRLLR